MSAKERMSGQIGASWLRVLLRQKAGEDGSSSRGGEDGVVPGPVPIPIGDRGGFFGLGPVDRDEAVAGSRDESGAVLRYAQGRRRQSLPGGGRVEPGTGRETGRIAADHQHPRPDGSLSSRMCTSCAKSARNHLVRLFR